MTISSRSSTCKLKEHSQQGFVKDANHLGGSRGGSSKQIRMASKCGPMHPFVCGLNQGQGQGHNHIGKEKQVLMHRLYCN